MPRGTYLSLKLNVNYIHKLLRLSHFYYYNNKTFYYRHIFLCILTNELCVIYILNQFVILYDHLIYILVNLRNSAQHFLNFDNNFLLCQKLHCFTSIFMRFLLSHAITMSHLLATFLSV